jgi:hypothetical protein
MATSPSHRFGQIIGDLLEEIMAPQLEEFCTQRDLYLDKKGKRGNARTGKKVTWTDKFGNNHDLDFVIEKGGSKNIKGRPLAFIEAAWRRYTKHSRNKAQEIQGAILPIAEKHNRDKPFLGAILAGIFTEGSLTQMQSAGFKLVLFPYDTIIDAFKTVNIDAQFDESTPDAVFQESIDKIEALTPTSRMVFKNSLIEANKARIESFFARLAETLDRYILRIVIIPLHGRQSEFSSLEDAIAFIQKYNQQLNKEGCFQKFEIIVQYNNGDKIDASFTEKAGIIDFLNYVFGTIQQHSNNVEN